MKINPAIIFIALIISGLAIIGIVSKKGEEEYKSQKYISDSVSKVNEADKLKQQKILEEKKSLARKNIFKKLRRNYDDIREKSWYYDKSTSEYVGNKFYIYFGVDKSGTITPRVFLSYYDEDWLFIERFIIKVGKYTFYINQSTNDGVRDVIDGGVYEYVDLELDENWSKIFDAILKSESVKLRCEGKDYYKDRLITKRERLALIRMYQYYKEII